MTLRVTTRSHRWRARFAALLVIGVSGLAVIASASGTPTRSDSATVKKPPFTIALSNAYIGNTWRVEFENLWKAATKMPPYNTLVKATNYNSGNDVSAQISQLDAMIASHVDAIVLDAASATGLNGTIQQACAQGILVISIDNRVTAPCAVKLGPSEFKFGEVGAQWLVDTLKGHGNVMMITGVPGTPDDNGRNAGVLSVFKKYPNIHIIAKYSGMWSSTTDEQRTRQILTTLGGKKINGVWVSGGSDGALHALEKAGYFKTGVTPPYMATEGENGITKAMVTYYKQGFRAISVGEPPYQVILGLAYATDILLGKAAKKDLTIPASVVVSDRAPYWEKTLNYVPIENAKVGLNVFPTESDSWFQNFQGAAVKMCLPAAVSGTPCPGSVVINVPGIPNP